MKLFKLSELSHDSEYKFYTAENLVSFIDKKNQGIEPNTTINLTLYEGKTKKEKTKSADFNIPTSLPYFFVNEEIKKEMEKIGINVEFIPVNTSDNRCFYFVLTLNMINIIEFNNKDDLLEMILDDKLIFKKDINLAGIYLFRDPNLITDTFFTEEFINIFKNKLKGAFFDEIVQ